MVCGRHVPACFVLATGRAPSLQLHGPTWLSACIRTTWKNWLFLHLCSLPVFLPSLSNASQGEPEQIWLPSSTSLVLQPVGLLFRPLLF